MTATTKTKGLASLGSIVPQLSVVLLTLIALVLGWVLKTSVENRSQAFTNGSISAQVPAGWLQVTPHGNELLHITDRTTSGFPTTYLIQQEPIAADTQFGQVASMLTLERGSSLTAYRVLGQQQVLVQGQDAIEIDYVYVESAANLTNAVMPVVVRGVDYIFLNGSQAVIVGYRADQSTFNVDLGRFYRFLVSVKF